MLRTRCRIAGLRRCGSRPSSRPYKDAALRGSRGAQGIKFIEELQQDRPDDLVLKRALAQQYQQAGRIEEAVAQLDSIADTFLNSGRKEEAIVTINQILLMNPPTANQYRQLLLQLQQH